MPAMDSNTKRRRIARSKARCQKQRAAICSARKHEARIRAKWPKGLDEARMAATQTVVGSKGFS
jgi:hypothetical protein